MDADLVRIFVGRLNPRTEERILEKEFSRFGKVLKIDLKQGYAFVYFSRMEDAEDAVQRMHNKDIDGNQIVVEAARNNNRNSNSNKGNTELRLSCSNLDPETSWQDLKDWARRAGNVTFANVYVREGQKLGVIEFETTEDVSKALQTLEEIPCAGSRVRLEKEDPNEMGGSTSSGAGDRNAGSGGFRRDLREKDRGGDRGGDYRGGGGRGGDRGAGGYRGGDRMDYRAPPDGRGDERGFGRDRDRGHEARGDPRFDGGASRYPEQSRYSDDLRRDGPGSYPIGGNGNGNYFREPRDERREVRREMPMRSRSRSRGRGFSNGNVPADRFRGQPTNFRGGGPVYDDFPSRGDGRGDPRGDPRGDFRDLRGDGRGDYAPREGRAPPVGGYNRGSPHRGGYDRR